MFVSAGGPVVCFGGDNDVCLSVTRGDRGKIVRVGRVSRTRTRGLLQSGGSNGSTSFAMRALGWRISCGPCTMLYKEGKRLFVPYARTCGRRVRCAFGTFYEIIVRCTTVGT